MYINIKEGENSDWEVNNCLLLPKNWSFPLTGVSVNNQ